MDNVDVFNKMLANSCPVGEFEKNRVVFRFDLHCAVAYILAERLGDSKYNVLKLRISTPNDPSTVTEFVQECV